MIMPSILLTAMFYAMLSCAIAITVSFEESQYSISENNGSAQLVLILSDPSLANITVHIVSLRDGGCI